MELTTELVADVGRLMGAATDMARHFDPGPDATREDAAVMIRAAEAAILVIEALAQARQGKGTPWRPDQAAQNGVTPSLGRRLRASWRKGGH